MRTWHCIGLALLVVLGVTVATSASPFADRFTFTRPPAPESVVDPKSGRLNIDIVQWSTPADRDRLVAAITQDGPEKLLDAFRDVGRIGTLYWPGGLEYTVRYALRSPRPDGGTEVTLVIDRPAWLWWNASAPSTPYQFSVVQIRFGKNGTGEGRLSLGVPVAADKTLGVALADYDKAPALLTDVRAAQLGTY